MAEVRDSALRDSTGSGTVNCRVLLVEDEALFARAVTKRLQQSGYDCSHAASLAEARAQLSDQGLPDLVLLDMRLPDGNGSDLLQELAGKDVGVIVLTAYGEVSDAVSAIKQGAVDYLKKPIDLDELLLVVEKAERSASLKSRLDYSRQRDSHAVEGVDFIGNSPQMQSVRKQIERIAQLLPVAAGVAPTVLISGETGTGKDVAARLLHHCCAEGDKPFVHVDCASLPAELIESELFGHEKGAFTNAQGARCGLIEAAEDGTLFLDEIGELPLALQAKLLNVLERRMVRRLGSTKERPVQARFVAATNRNLQQMVAAGQFRADLFYRLNVLSVSMPPLRERGGDILLLARHFVRQTERRYDLQAHAFSRDAVDALQSYGWPGNVRELKHQVSRAVMLCQQDEITVADLAIEHPLATPASPESVVDGSMTLDAAEKAMIENALKQSHGNVSEAARLLGITRMTIRYRMEKHGIKDR